VAQDIAELVAAALMRLAAAAASEHRGR